jgi:peptidoglycan/LPS O-acetylase OafA/YrhL
MSEPQPNEGRVYFPALDGLRFVAFGLVFLFHRGIPQIATAINAISRQAGYKPVTAAKAPWSVGDSVLDNGWIGVQFFFILSGFLITTLLLREESRFGKIDLRAFWMRRILRIWPLYYLIVALTFFVLPWLDGAWGTVATRELWSRHLVPFLVFGGNWSMALLGPVPYDAISVLWSVCVEEQFYILCPMLIAFVRPENRVRLVVGLMLLGVAGRVITAMALEQRVVTPVFFQWSTITQLDTLLSGVLLALLRERLTPKWEGSGRFLLSLALVLLGIGLLAKPGLGHGSVAGRALDFVAIWVVGVFAVSLAATNRGFVSRALSYPRIVWLGRISYGLYMYHEIAFFLQRKLFEFVGWFPYQEAVAPLASMALTVGLAAASYKYVEQPFLRKKMRWSRVESRPI